MHSSVSHAPSPGQISPFFTSPVRVTVPATRLRGSFSSQNDSPSHRTACDRVQPTNGINTPHSAVSSVDRSFFSSPLSIAERSGNATGNLADELADIWDEEEKEEGRMHNQFNELHIWEESPSHGKMNSWSRKIQSRNSNAGSTPKKDTSLSELPSTLHVSVFQEMLTSIKHDQSNCSYPAGHEKQGISQDKWMTTSLYTLQACVAQLEELTHISHSSTHISSDICQLMTLLREITTQSQLEALISTYINTHAALTTSVLQQARSLASLSSILLSPFSNVDLDTFNIGNLSFSTMSIENTTALARIRKRVSGQNPQQQLMDLENTTTAVINTLSNLTDTLHIEQELSTTFARRLKVVCDLVAEMKRDQEENDMAHRWIEEGNWQERLYGREYERRCRDEVRGFEEVCGGWREILVTGAG